MRRIARRIISKERRKLTCKRERKIAIAVLAAVTLGIGAITLLTYITLLNHVVS